MRASVECAATLVWRAARLRCPNHMFNIIAAELVFARIFLGVLIATWPSPPWDLLPFSKTLFLAFDLIFRPPAAEDFT